MDNAEDKIKILQDASFNAGLAAMKMAMRADNMAEVKIDRIEKSARRIYETAVQQFARIETPPRYMQ